MSSHTPAREGSLQSRSAWLDFPPTLTAKSPLDRNVEVKFRFHSGDLVKAALAGRKAPVFETWSVLFGQAPPVPNIRGWNEDPDSGLTSLAEAHACFQGVKRPCAEDDDGEGILAYILRPRFLYRFKPDMKCVATKKGIRDGLLYIAHVRLDHPERLEKGETRGVFTHGGFVEADPANDLLPVEHQTRYLRQHW